MSYHDMRALRAGASLVPESLDTFLLDQCRCFAAARSTGSALPLDDAYEALAALLPPAGACAVFGALHRLVAVLTEGDGPAPGWYPPSCHRASPGEMRVLVLLADVAAARTGWLRDDIAPFAAAPALLAALDMLAHALTTAGLVPEPMRVAADFGRHVMAERAA